MKKFNSRLVTLFNWIMIFILIAIPAGLVFQSIRVAEFMKDCPDNSCGSWIGIYFAILIPAELYLILIYIWLRALKTIDINRTFKLVQLVIIFIVGILPGLFLSYAAIFKQ